MVPNLFCQAVPATYGLQFKLIECAMEESVKKLGGYVSSMTPIIVWHVINQLAQVFDVAYRLQVVWFEQLCLSMVRILFLVFSYCFWVVID